MGQAKLSQLNRINSAERRLGIPQADMRGAYPEWQSFYRGLYMVESVETWNSASEGARGLPNYAVLRNYLIAT